MSTTTLVQEPIKVTILGKKRTVGHYFPDKLPLCQVHNCGKKIPLERALRSSSLGNEEPKYCSARCANVQANRYRHDRAREIKKNESEIEADRTSTPSLPSESAVKKISAMSKSNVKKAVKSTKK